MYEAFYGLSEAPFRLTPDPHYLYLSGHHREALGHLLFGIREGTGFVAVTGEIGTGKTTLLRALLRDLEPNTVVAYIFNPALSDVELLQTINSEFRLPATTNSKKELVDQLNRFLVAQKAVGARVVVIVDEAQSLEPVVLEQLRLLSNLETETEKLLQIVLVGQPELRQLLGRPNLKQLNQRITIRWHLAPLDRSETANYVRHRLRIAGGAAASGLFSPAALRHVYRYARGVPRLINIAAHRALLSGYTREERTIGARTARRAIAELTRDDAAPSPERSRLRRPALAATAAALGLALAAAFALLPPRDPLPLTLPPEVATLPVDAADPGAVEPGATQATAGEAGAAVPLSADADLARAEPVEGAGLPAVAAPVEPSGAPDAHAATQPPPPVPPDAGVFWSTLATVNHRTSALTATTDLLAAWNVETLRTEERDRPSLDLDAIALQRGLRYLRISGNLARLQLLNLPAILELSVPSTGQRRFAVLAGIEGGRSVLRSGALATSLADHEVAEVWFGDAHLFWRDFENLPPFLAAGSIGPEVERLHRLLARVGEYTSTPSPTYDDATAEAIARFQRSHRLAPDGIVGPLTKIVLYDAVAGYEHPRLGGGG